MQLMRTMLSIVAVACVVPGVARAQAAGDSVVAQIRGASLVERDLDAWWRQQDASTYERIRRDAYDGRRRALDALLAERLLAWESERRGVSAEALLEHEVVARARPVTEADVQAFLTNNPLPAGTSSASAAPLVMALLSQRAREAARDEYFQALRQNPAAGVRVLLEPPRVSLTRAAYNPTRGRGDAPIEMVVFSDFECPYCRRAVPVLKRIADRFGDEVRIVWKHYPLSIHVRAKPAAEAAQCAHDQGRFWDYHDVLFSDPSGLDSNGLIAAARRIGLDSDTFQRCLDTHLHAPEVAEDMEAGARAGVSGTPTTFINGVALVGVQSFEVYEQVILAELQRSASRPVSFGAEQR